MNIKEVAPGAEKAGAENAGANGAEPANSRVGSEVLRERDRDCFGIDWAEGLVDSSTTGSLVFLAAERLAGAFFAAIASTEAASTFVTAAAFEAAVFTGLVTVEAAFLAAGLRVVLAATESVADALTGTFESFLFTISGVLQAAFG